MAIFGLILVALFRALVTEKKLTAYAVEAAPDAAGGEAVRHDGFRAPVSSLFTNPAVLFAYIGGGLQMFTAAVLLAWLPSFFNRYYDLAPRTRPVSRLPCSSSWSEAGWWSAVSSQIDSAATIRRENGPPPSSTAPSRW